MTRIALLAANVVGSDAVSNDVLGMHRVLSARGHEVRVFAGQADVTSPEVLPLKKARRFLSDPAALLIYHHCTSWAEGVRALEQARCRRVVKYHNVTPPEFFRNVDGLYARACAEGRRQLASLARAGCDLYLADSAYNREELEAEGAPAGATAVVPPFHGIERLNTLEADWPTLDRYRDGRTNLLAVGRLVPNKGHRALLDAFAVYRKEYDPTARLVIVGKALDGLTVYNRVLEARVRELGLADAVEFAGAVSDRTLKACYLAADVYLCTSEHEGFCVPLVEAMALKLPVVAVASTAVPETLDGAGLVWEEADPRLLAGSVHRLVTDEAARTTLGHRGWQRYRKHFANERIEERFRKALDGLLCPDALSV